MDKRTENTAAIITSIVRQWTPRLLPLPEDAVSGRANRQNRTIKQLVGHLIDSASNNHQRMVRLQYGSDLLFPDYTSVNDRWIAIQNYRAEPWSDMVQLWKFYNLHLAHLIRNIDPAALENTWTDEQGRRVSLRFMTEIYLSHLEMHIGEIERMIDD